MRLIDLGHVLDAYPLDELPESVAESSNPYHSDERFNRFFADAQKLDLVPEIRGGTLRGIGLKDDDYQSHLASRREAGRGAAITSIPAHSQREVRTAVNDAFERSFPKRGFMAVSRWETGAEGLAWAKTADSLIRERLGKDGIDVDRELDAEDAELIRSIQELAASDDTDGDQLLEDAQDIAFRLGDRSIERLQSSRGE